MLDFRTQILPYLNVNDDGLPIDRDLFHAGYDVTIKIAEEIAQVFGDEYPKFLDINRPKEKKHHKKYRADIYRNVVSRFRTQATLMVGTIHQNDDYKVKFPTKQKSDTLQEYTEEGLFTNATYIEWFFAEWTKAYIDDPNSVVAPYLNLTNINDTQYQEPKLKLVSSEGVIQHNDNFCVLRGDELTYIKVGEKKQKVGRNLYFYDKESFVICKQVEKRTQNNNRDTNYIWEIIAQNIIQDTDGEIIEVLPFLHNYKNTPVYKVGRVLGKKIDGEVQIYRSEVSDALPHLKNILQRVSDSEIELLQHVHTINYYYVPKNTCNAVGCENGYITYETGIIDMPKGKKVCEKCGGNGGMPANALEDIVITIPEWGGIEGEKAMNFGVPAGTIPRNIATVQELRIEIDKQWYFAMATLNAQWMMEAPLNTSGKSKAYDRQEYTKREADISLHIKKQQTAHYNWVASIRYGLTEKVSEILPTINVPTDNFDIYTQEEALQEYSTAIEKGMNGVITNGLSIAYSEKKFGSTSDITKRLRLKNKIDPYISISGNGREERLMLNLFNQIKIFGLNESEKLKAIIENTYLSLNLDAIITKLVNTKNGFLNSTFEQQQALILIELSNYIPETISEDIFKSIKAEPLTDIESQKVIN